MNIIKKTLGITLFGFFISLSMAQTPPPPNNGNGAAGGGNNPVGGGAPLADGLIMLLSASILYICYTEKEHIISLFQKTSKS